MEELSIKQAELVTGGEKVGEVGHYYACPICKKKDYTVQPNHWLKCNACGNTWSPK